MKTVLKPILFLAIFSLYGCATIISGSRQNVEFNSNPGSATVFINGVKIGETPVQKNLKRNQEYDLVFKLDGYKTYETGLEKKFNEWYIGNVLFGGLIGIVIDPITGAIYKLRPEGVTGKSTVGLTWERDEEDMIITISLEKEDYGEKIGQLQKDN